MASSSLDTAKFVSRAGLKLEHALNHFQIDPTDLICADFGCNLGGFTDCLLQNGAGKIYSVDTSKNCLEWNLRHRPKIVVLEQSNAMHVELPEKVDLIVSDVAWTKQEKILPNIKANLKPSGRVLTLIKPHYEAYREELTKGKVNESALQNILARLELVFQENGFDCLGITKSPITGRSGRNTEYIALLKISKS